MSFTPLCSSSADSVILHSHFCKCDGTCVYAQFCATQPIYFNGLPFGRKSHKCMTIVLHQNACYLVTIGFGAHKSMRVNKVHWDATKGIHVFVWTYEFLCAFPQCTNVNITSIILTLPGVIDILAMQFGFHPPTPCHISLFNHFDLSRSDRYLGQAIWVPSINSMSLFWLVVKKESEVGTIPGSV